VKIAFFNDTYHPYVSGVIRSMERFAAALRDGGHNVTMVVPGHVAPETRQAHRSGLYELLSIPVPGFDGMRIGTPIMTDGHFGISDTLDRGIDIIHAHSPFVVGRMGARLAEKRDLPLVFTCHSIYPNYSDQVPLVSELAGDVIREYVVDYCLRCDLILAPSEYVREVLREWGVHRDIEVLPSGIELDAFERGRAEVQARGAAVRQRLVRKAGLPRDSRILLFVGRLDHRKNIDFLLDVLAILPDCEGSPVHLVILGEGPARNQLEEQVVQRGVNDRVSILGKQPFEEVVRWYATSDVFGFPSTVETQGLVLVEAMAAGLPVVARDSPTSDEVIEHGVNGLLSEPDPAVFAGHVRDILTDAQLASDFRAAGIETARDYSTEVLAERLIHHYNALLSENRPRRAKGGGARRNLF